MKINDVLKKYKNPIPKDKEHTKNFKTIDKINNFEVI